MKTKYALPMVLAGSVMLTGCWLDDDDDPATTSVRVLHASSDAPAVNVRVNGDVVVPGADYKQAAVLTPGAGLADIAVDGLLPGGETATVISADGVSLRADTNYDVIAVGKVGDETIEPLILTDDGARDDANSARLRVAHLSPEAQTAAGGPVDVYVTASETRFLTKLPSVSPSKKASAHWSFQPPTTIGSGLPLQVLIWLFLTAGRLVYREVLIYWLARLTTRVRMAMPVRLV